MPECQKSTSAPIIADCQQTPEWLTKDYMTEKLRIFYKDASLEVTSLVPSLATAKGENYASVMTRVAVQFNRSGIPTTRSIIVKSSFEGDEFANEKLKPYDVYNKELGIYQKIIPKLNALLEQIGDADKMFPETIAVDYDHKAIIFEDLAVKKYIIGDRTKGLNMEQAKMTLRKLAKMHAASAVLNEREPGTFQSYDRGMFNRHTNSFGTMFVGMLDACGKLVSQWDDFKEYGVKLINLKPKLMEYGAQVFDPIENHLNVLAHGDFWTNNIMFNYSENDEPNDVKLIDFQFSFWGSPAIDLHYFFNTTLREELRLHHQDELFQYYYDVLSVTLRDLHYQAEIPSFETFLDQMAEKSFYAFVSACLIQPIQVNEQTEDADFHSLMGDDERALNFRNRTFQSEKVQRNLKRLLPMFDRRGLLDHRD